MFDLYFVATFVISKVQIDRRTLTMNQLLSGKLDGAVVSLAELSTLTSSVDAMT